MAQEVTIIMLVDIPAALDAGTLEGNLYLVDNLKTEGSENEGTGKLVSAINGTHWFDGSQASEQLINWLPYSITSLSPQLPRFYADDRLDKLKDDLIRSVSSSGDAEMAEGEGGGFSNSGHLAATLAVPALTRLKDKTGRKISDDVPLMDLRGNFVSANKAPQMKFAADAGNQQGTGDLGGAEMSDISYLTPQIYNITGEAVEKGVIYPAQYGTPAPIKGGWYWCAAVNTYMTGVYTYTMHITLYKPELHGDETVWLPVNFTYDAKIKVSSGAMRNGFTGGSLGTLPVM
ncbi:hypothetical protein [Chitinophaga sancti]|uniref:Uncharacterized protein n=1 Tax=Chitinophaga sancti TaxID=1004 RepID=A0A1K1SNN1_9BACT|nr:hypothetical protein [Chitinophaga sancti]WQD60057.1 hypothetical protein U0033_19395 [Chitinophaga sancti]WQG87814.1 hypothetical protein SR876_23075 [Chitinophaga sancti]SFW85820.1 hypothetical protein SAMN05661012_05793 [Chitinophaga sancti]